MDRKKENEAAEAKYGKIENLKVLNTEDVYNMLVGAIEGGSNYWYEFDLKSDRAIHKIMKERGTEFFVDGVLMAVNSGIVLTLKDGNTGEKLGELGLGSWARAEELMIESHRHILGDILGENDDAGTADAFFQLAVMGEVVYG